MFNASLRGNKVHFTSLGCPRNLVDTEVMLGILLKAGYEATQDECDADYLVVNTCGFLEASRKESLDTIQALLDKKKHSAKLVVTGCMVQHHRDEIKKSIPEVNYILGSGDVNHILELIQTEEDKEIITSSRSYLEAGEVPRKVSTPKHFAYLKIAEGCRKRCAFCIIPKIKGPLKSKNTEQILKEFHALLNQGVHEIILIAQDLGDYGKDSGQKDGLTALLKEMLDSTKKDFWLRLLYLYPDEITDELIDLIKSDSRICHYLDMPIQHVNDTILTAMRRKTSKSDIIQTITKLRNAIPDIIIRTSLMVGFPGETEEQFQELKAFVKEHSLDHIGIFKFSQEKGAAAATYDNQISDEVKEKRFQDLMQTQQKVVAKRNKKWLGKQIPVMLDGLHPESDLLIVGRFYGQCPEIDGQVIINDGRNAKALGELHLVEITQVAGYDLIGTVIKPIVAKATAKPKSSRLLQVVS
ncbi:MAG: 30S ribosomal protein S12 methylthiotransferase RimO [Chlamydiales bacterium]|nr:30S ribosomal protein S12 methylthiotransferase RimO [Chlamydiales bacterium]